MFFDVYWATGIGLAIAFAFLLWFGLAQRAATGTPDACSLCSVIFTHASEEPLWWEPTTIMWYKPACCHKWVCDMCIYGVDNVLLADDRFCQVCVTGSWYRHLRTPRCLVLGSNTIGRSATTSTSTPLPSRSSRRTASPGDKTAVNSNSTHKKVK